MKEYIIKLYNTNDYNRWNEFVANAKNATFLFNRDFMEYHSDRFMDYSLIVLDGEKWVAVLPANIVNNEVHSHQGLTYGGLVCQYNLKLANVISIFKVVLEYLNQKQIAKLHIKIIPSIYNKKPADELLYCMYTTQAKLIKRDSLSVIDLQASYTVAKDRKEGIRKGEKAELTVIETTDFKPFWNEILEPNMVAKHGVKPIHSLVEITKLQQLFPKNIRQFNVYQNNKIVAGTTIFETDNVAHSQYIFGDESKNTNGSLDFLYNHLITNVFKDKKYLDFGSSNGYEGNNLNIKLSYWKQSFGASTITQDFYEMETANFKLLDIA